MGSFAVRAMALASPVVDPPPIATQQSTCKRRAAFRAASATSEGTCITAPSNTPADRAPEHHDDIGADGTLFRSAQHQRPRRA